MMSVLAMISTLGSTSVGRVSIFKTVGKLVIQIDLLRKPTIKWKPLDKEIC